MMNLISKIKMVFDTVTSFFQTLNFVREYVKKHSENKKNVVLTAKMTNGNFVNL